MALVDSDGLGIFNDLMFTDPNAAPGDNGLDPNTGWARGVVEDSSSPSGYSYNGIPVNTDGSRYEDRQAAHVTDYNNSPAGSSTANYPLQPSYPGDYNGDGINDSTGLANGVIPDSSSPSGYSYNGQPVLGNGAPYNAPSYPLQPSIPQTVPDVTNDPFGNNAPAITPQTAPGEFDNQNPYIPPHFENGALRVGDPMNPQWINNQGQVWDSTQQNWADTTEPTQLGNLYGAAQQAPNVADISRAQTTPLPITGSMFDRMGFQDVPSIRDLQGPNPTKAPVTQADFKRLDDIMGSQDTTEPRYGPGGIYMGQGKKNGNKFMGLLGGIGEAVESPVKYATGPLAAQIWGDITDPTSAAKLFLTGGLPAMITAEVAKTIQDYGDNKAAYQQFLQNPDVNPLLKATVDTLLNPINYLGAGVGEGAGALATVAKTPLAMNLLANVIPAAMQQYSETNLPGADIAGNPYAQLAAGAIGAGAILNPKGTLETAGKIAKAPLKAGVALDRMINEPVSTAGIGDAIAAGMTIPGKTKEEDLGLAFTRGKSTVAKTATFDDINYELHNYVAADGSTGQYVRVSPGSNVHNPDIYAMVTSYPDPATGKERWFLDADQTAYMNRLRASGGGDLSKADYVNTPPMPTYDNPMEAVHNFLSNKIVYHDVRDPLSSRLFVHNTGNLSYDLPDPEYGVRSIMQGAGLYITGHPSSTGDMYGGRAIIIKYDGPEENIVHLDRTADPQIWQGVIDDINRKTHGKLNLGNVEDVVSRYGKYKASLGSYNRAEASGYQYRDAIVGAIRNAMEHDTRLSMTDFNNSLGRFKRLESTDIDSIGKSIINDSLGNIGKDAIFHPSRTDGDTLVAINPDNFRVVANVNKSQSLNDGMTLQDIINIHHRPEANKPTYSRDDSTFGYGVVSTADDPAKFIVGKGEDDTYHLVPRFTDNNWRYVRTGSGNPLAEFKFSSPEEAGKFGEKMANFEPAQIKQDGLTVLNSAVNPEEKIYIEPDYSSKGYQVTMVVGDKWTEFFGTDPNASFIQAVDQAMTHYIDNGGKVVGSVQNVKTYGLNSETGGINPALGISIGTGALGALAGVNQAPDNADWKTKLAYGAAGAVGGAALGALGTKALSKLGPQADNAIRDEGVVSRGMTAPEPPPPPKRQAEPGWYFPNEHADDPSVIAFSQRLMREGWNAEATPEGVRFMPKEGQPHVELPTDLTTKVFRAAPKVEPIGMKDLEAMVGQTPETPVDTANAIAQTGAKPKPGQSASMAVADQASVLSRIKDKALTEIVDAMNVPRSIKASIDLSASLRQAAILGLSHPIDYVQSYVKQLKALGSQGVYDAVQKSIRDHPLWQTVGEDGKAIPGPLQKVFFSGIGDHILDNKEELFATRLAGSIPGVKQSERAYVTMLDNMRYQVFTDTVAKWMKAGKIPTDADYSNLAAFINHATGRGTGAFLDKYAQGLSMGFFAPRYWVSRPQVLWDAIKPGQSWMVRQEVIKALGAYAAWIAPIAGLASLAGYDFVYNPLKTGFGGITDPQGRSRADLSLGFGRDISTAYQALKGERINKVGETVPVNAGESLGKYIQGKFSPNASTLWALFTGQDYNGNHTSLNDTAGFWQTMANEFAPISASDVWSAYKVYSDDSKSDPTNVMKFIGNVLASLHGVGMNFNPDTEYDKRDQYVRQISDGKYQSYKELPPVGDISRQSVDKDWGGKIASDKPEVQQSMAIGQQQRFDNINRQLNIDAMGPGKDWRDAKHLLDSFMAGQINDRKLREPDSTTYNSQMDKDVAEWGKVIDTNTSSPGKVNWDAVDEWMAANPDKAANVNLYLHGKNTDLTPMVTDYHNSIQKLADSGYWNIKNQIWENLNKTNKQEQYRPGESFIDYKNRAIDNITGQLVKQGINEATAKKQAQNYVNNKMPGVKLVEDIFNSNKDDWFAKHPDVLQELVRWGYIETPNKKEDAILQNHKTPPLPSTIPSAADREEIGRAIEARQ